MDGQNAKLLSDYRSMTDQMESRCKLMTNKEIHYKERTQKAKERILIARQKIHMMHEKRAEKEYAIERCEFKTKNIDSRLKTVEQKIEHSRISMRIDSRGSENLVAKQKQLKDSFMKQSELQAKLIRGMRRKDALEKQLQSAQDRDARLRERIVALIDRLKFLMVRQDEKKRGIRTKVENIKRMHPLILELEPKLRETFTRMRRIEVVVFELEDLINRKEDEIRRVHKEIGYAKDERERTSTEIQVKNDKSFRGPNAIKELLNK